MDRIICNQYTVALFFTIIALCCMATNTSAQQLSGRADTSKIIIPAKESPFGLLGIPSDLINSEYIEGHGLTPMKKFEIRRDYTEEFYKYGLMRPNVNLHMDFSNPRLQWNPFLYALALVGAFFNNRIVTIQEEQYRYIMNNLYDYPTPSSRYEVTQYNISKGIFGNPGITVSGFKTFVPERKELVNPITGETK